MARNWMVAALLGGTLLAFAAPAPGQLLPLAYNRRPKLLFRYGKGNWAYTNYQRFYDPNRKEFFWGWPGDFYGLDYDQPPISQAIPPVLLVDLAGGVGWEQRGHLLVQVPVKDAQVWFGDWQTPQKGFERSFDSPPWEPGKSYSYRVRVRWRENGKDIERSRNVILEAGQEVVLDFTSPIDYAPPAPK